MRLFVHCVRIAFSATCVIAAALLIALWVRSYSNEDYVYFPLTSDRMITVHSTANRLRTSTYSLTNVQNNPVWQSGIILKGWGRMTFDGQQISRSPNHMFGAGSDFSSAWVQVPYWFPLVLCFAVAAIPWLGHGKFRFSLRTLFIATTLAAASLGIIVWANR
jgi:hypothetical protein